MKALVDESAEAAVLGAIVVRNAAFDDIGDLLEPEHFGREHHQQIFEAMRNLHGLGKAIDYVTLQAELGRMGVLEDTGRVYVSRLGDGVPTSTNVKYYAGIVRDKAILRGVRDAARKLIADAEAAEMSGAALLEQAEADIYGLGSKATSSQWVTNHDLALRLMPVLERIFAEKRTVTGIPSGFSDLDGMTRGFQSGDLVLVGARPSQGKTAFGMQVAHQAAKKVNVAFFSIEMSLEAVGLRQIIQVANVDGYRMLTGRSSEMEQRRIGEGIAELGERSLIWDDAPYLSPLQLRSKLRKFKAQFGAIGLVVIDYLQLMAPLPDDRRENKTNQVAGISRMLKLLAREFGVPFLVLSQLHRVPDNRRPNMADLRDSGALEQDADVVLLLHRPEVYESTPQNAGLAEVIIGKQRQGPTGIVELAWRGEPMRFENRSRM